MILSHKEIEEIAAAVTKDFHEFFFGPDTDGRRLPRGTPCLLYTSIRRLHITATHVIDAASDPSSKDSYEQIDLFTDYAGSDAKRKQEDGELAREKKVQQAMLTIKKKFGKNAILKWMNLSEGATAKDRTAQLGGHKA